MNGNPNHRLVAVGVACLLVAASIALGASPALAQSGDSDDQNVLDSWLTDEDEPTADEENSWFDLEVDTEAWRSKLSQASAALDGQFDRMQASVGSVFDDEEVRPNNETVAQTKAELNSNSQTYVAEINARTSPSEAFDTHRIIVSHDGSKNAVLYVVGNVTSANNTTSLESITALNKSEFNATYSNRSVDETWGVDGDFAEDLPTRTDELANRIANNESLGRDYQAKLLGRYCGSTSLTDPGECDVRSTLWMNDSDIDVGEWTPDADSDEEEEEFLWFLSVSLAGVVSRVA
ncbi:hypothetical protein [Halorubellus sp. PRR65]|uniref:hypothetical protein n=1 Tax=Halorubellus sp. PRR65 TaxID=3098148 RepID=UPI002B2623C7|nr:hypothetical protein [Halorubellus sp. PRR65]